MKKILIVEDADVVLETEKYAAKTAGFEEILESVEGSAARELIAAHPDLENIITDWEYPEGGGAELLEYLAGRNFKGKIMIVTANLQTIQDAQKQYEGRLNIDGMTKPFKMPALIEKIKDFFGSPSIVPEPLPAGSPKQRPELLKAKS